MGGRSPGEKPFAGATAALETGDVPSEPRIETLDLTKREVRDLARDPAVVAASPLPVNASTDTARLLANADTVALAPGVDIADRGVGLVRAP